MDLDNEIDSDYTAMVELTQEISSIVQNSIDQYEDELNPREIEHILKITTDVIAKSRKLPVKLIARCGIATV